MNFSSLPRTVTPLGRLPWYRRIDWFFPLAVVLSAGATGFIIWCAGKALVSWGN